MRFVFAGLLMLCFPLVVAAQFGPQDAAPTPRPVAEITADRALQTASNLSDEDYAVKSGALFQTARENYSALCKDRTGAKDLWVRNCFKLATLYRQGAGIAQDYTAAKALYDALCLQADHIASCLQQAHLSHTGRAANTDWPHARLLYTHACALKDPLACAGLGNMLYRGQGGRADRTRGKTLLQQACRSGNDWSCQRLEDFGLTLRN